jgi:spore coat polysaccharide biosynthesis protein SpsF
MTTMKRVCAIIQARMTSSRLPGKVLINICGKPMIQHIYERLSACRNISGIILAIPDAKESDPLAEQAKNMGCPFHRGDEADVLSRFYGAAKAISADRVIRVTGDCPLVDPAVTDWLIEEYSKGAFDYMAVDQEGGFPRGLDSEMFTFDILEQVHGAAHLPYEREHVTPYIYQHPDLFKTLFVEAEGKLRRPDLRLTVDTDEDLELLSGIYQALYHEDRIFGIGEAIDFIDGHPELKGLNAHIRQKQLGE